MTEEQVNTASKDMRQCNRCRLWFFWSLVENSFKTGLCFKCRDTLEQTGQGWAELPEVFEGIDENTKDRIQEGRKDSDA